MPVGVVGVYPGGVGDYRVLSMGGLGPHEAGLDGDPARARRAPLPRLDLLMAMVSVTPGIAHIAKGTIYAPLAVTKRGICNELKKEFHQERRRDDGRADHSKGTIIQRTG